MNAAGFDRVIGAAIHVRLDSGFSYQSCRSRSSSYSSWLPTPTGN